jgi:hypothetical protein
VFLKEASSRKPKESTGIVEMKHSTTKTFVIDEKNPMKEVASITFFLQRSTIDHLLPHSTLLERAASVFSGQTWRNLSLRLLCHNAPNKYFFQ